MAYLKQIEISGVQEVGVDNVKLSAYTRKLKSLRLLTNTVRPWVPVPGPDPFDELVVVNKATWSENNVYAVGETISGTSATFVGGTGNETYRSRVQFKSATDSDWTNTEWTNHLNVPKVISGVIPPGQEKGEVRFKTQAIDTFTSSSCAGKFYRSYPKYCST